MRKEIGAELMGDTLSDGLETYRIGPKLRELRLAKGLALAQLGDHTGLSAGMLSKIERGQVFPTLPTLLRIALVFGVGLDHFFAEGAERPVLEVVRAKNRLKLPDTPQGEPAFFFESLDFPVSDSKLGAYLAEFPAGGQASEPHAHAGVELLYVLRGRIEIGVHDGVQELGTGDSIYFESGFDHTYRALGDAGAQALVVVSNP